MIVIFLQEDAFDDYVTCRKFNETSWKNEMHVHSTSGVHRTTVEWERNHLIIEQEWKYSFDDSVRRKDKWSTDQLKHHG